MLQENRHPSFFLSPSPGPFLVILAKKKTVGKGLNATENLTPFRFCFGQKKDFRKRAQFKWTGPMDRRENVHVGIKGGPSLAALLTLVMVRCA